MIERDQNTKYFHISASNRRRNNFITEIQNEDKVYSNQSEIHKAFLEYYKELLGFKEDSMVETDLVSLYPENHIDLTSLENLFIEIEIKNAIFSLPGDKALGPDRFPISFYQKHGQLLNLDILAFFEAIYK